MSKNQSNSNSRAKETLKLGASTLINNQACIDMARTRPWYGAVVCALLSVVLAVTPIMVSQFSAQGGNILETPDYSLNEGLVRFGEALNEKGASLLIDSETDTLIATNWSSQDGVGAMKSTADACWSYKAEGETYLRVYVYAELEGAEFANRASSAIDTTSSDPSSLLILGKSSFYMYKFAINSTTSQGSLQGTYDRVEADFDLKDFTHKDSKGNEYDVNGSNYNATNYDKYLANVKNAWAGFLNDAYETNKVASAWKWTGIMSGVFALFIVFMGFLIWLMSRGKNNPYRIFTFWETQKMAYWAAFSPAVIGMVLSFFNSSMTMMAFIMMMGLRIMWLSMKSMRPE